MRFALVLFFLVVGFHPMLLAQDSLTIEREASAPIQDNSFLVEEAYNQEDGVVQHISSFERLTNSHDWVYTQTDEWPVRTLKHQVSITLAGTHAGSFAGSGAGWGDTALNYRYQLVGSGETKVAIAPRLSMLLPTGDHKFGRGSGGVGLQTNLPVSIQHSSHFVSHWNAGATWIPSALNERPGEGILAEDLHSHLRGFHGSPTNPFPGDFVVLLYSAKHQPSRSPSRQGASGTLEGSLSDLLSRESEY